MANLRSKLIKLAHQHPELRGDLLPLLKEAATPLERANVVRRLELLHGSLEETLEDLQDIIHKAPKGGAAQESLSRVNRALQGAVAAASLSLDELEQGRYFGPF